MRNGQVSQGRMYNAMIRPILLYASETWPIRVEDIRRLSVFESRCLRSICGVSWDMRISNSEVRKKVFGNRSANRSLEQLINQNRLRWLGHVLRMGNNRLPYKCLFEPAHVMQKKHSGGQAMTWQRSMKKVSAGLCQVGRCRLPGWNKEDGPNQWLDTLKDMAKNRSQWRSCIMSLTSSN